MTASEGKPAWCTGFYQSGEQSFVYKLPGCSKHFRGRVN